MLYFNKNNNNSVVTAPECSQRVLRNTIKVIMIYVVLSLETFCHCCSPRHFMYAAAS